MKKELIEQLKKEREDDFTNEKERNGITKEIQRIQIRLNNYNNKFDWWKSNRDEELIKSYSAEPVASALGEQPRLWLLTYKILAFLPKTIICINWAASFVGVIC